MQDMFADFAFLDPGPLVDGDLELVIEQRYPGDPTRGYVPAYEFEMRRRGEATKAGYIHLRVALTPRLAEFGGHIGYAVEPAYRGRRWAARACQLLFPLAKRHGIDPLLITCSPDNPASKRTCEIIGGRFVRTATVENEPGIWRLTCYYHVSPE